MTRRLWTLFCAGLLALAAEGRTQSRAEPRPERRAIWVTRFDYRTANDVRAILSRCAETGFDTVLFQVRGNATAFYDSPYEPWAEQLGWEDPGFDPLALACDLADELDLELHAWVNVVPGWWGTEPPGDPEHLYNRRPEWFWYDQNGDRQALSERFYVSLNPCLPEVRSYLVLVLADLVRRYRVDGLHLDYMRFPNEPPGTPAGSALDYPRDARTLALFAEATGETPDEAPEAWDRWRTERVTELVRRIRTATPGVFLSSAVTAIPERGREHFQDAMAWIEEGLVDAVFPMNYTGDPELFDQRLEPWRAVGERVAVVPGIRVDEGNVASARRRLEIARRDFGGFCLFGYASLFDTVNTAIAEQDAEARAARARTRAEWLPLLASPR